MEALHRIVTGMDKDLIIVRCVEDNNNNNKEEDIDKEKEQKEIDDNIDDCMRRIIESFTYDD